MDGNELAAQFIGDTRWNGLPDAVQHKVKMCLVDIIAAIAGGVRARALTREARPRTGRSRALVGRRP